MSARFDQRYTLERFPINSNMLYGTNYNPNTRKKMSCLKSAGDMEGLLRARRWGKSEIDLLANQLIESSRYTIPNSARPLHIKDGGTFFVSLERPPVISEDGPGSVPRGACPPLLGGSEDASRRRYFTLADIARNGCFICAVQAKAKK